MRKYIKLIIPIAIILIFTTVGLSLFFTRYMWDVKDTETLFRENVNKVGYANTIETAIPQTALYDVVESHFNSPLASGKTVKKAIIIGYDGCRADILTEMQAENSGIREMLSSGANINLTYCGGVNYPLINTQDTSTAPGWCSILTGQWADKHGITKNGVNKSLDTKTLLLSLIESKAIQKSTFITKWAGHFTNKKSTYLLEKQYAENNGLNVLYNKCKNDEGSLNATIGELSKENCADFTFVIYEHTDATGHNSGFSFNNPKYKEAFKTADEYGYKTIKTIKDRPTYDSEDWLIIITSDHGGIKTGHGKKSIQERMTFAVMNAEF